MIVVVTNTWLLWEHEGCDKAECWWYGGLIQVHSRWSWRWRTQSVLTWESIVGGYPRRPIAFTPSGMRIMDIIVSTTAAVEEGLVVQKIAKVCSYNAKNFQLIQWYQCMLMVQWKNVRMNHPQKGFSLTFITHRMTDVFLVSLSLYFFVICYSSSWLKPL